MTSKLILGTVSLTVVILLSACTGDKNEVGVHETKVVNESQGNSGMDHSSMNPTSTNEVPKGLKIAENPTYPIGSHVVIKADHMEGMKNAKATIVGAYNTTAYIVSYTPTNGGEPVTNHKWVIQEELEGMGGKALKPGEKAVINADHMEGMKGANATIESALVTTVYMVDYTSTSGEEVKNHKWVTENELTSQ
ncbi:hypothetical protein LYSIN_01341 [Lysinibacillus sphaericus]|uniref:DUF1541 domain-containing protein n=1 Tax=Lysinibacillus sphaericus TaxID=1421 RepID=A0A2S5D0P2_LYSSH|nr:YdhK family protein [Lysinibacillus sphaericus]POZ56558.1 hypothetical protein LYSIN_01341 [Lysinibacillus sphaericus]